MVTHDLCVDTDGPRSSLPNAVCTALQPPSRTLTEVSQMDESALTTRSSDNSPVWGEST
jgi:hypothetical protein